MKTNTIAMPAVVLAIYAFFAVLPTVHAGEAHRVSSPDGKIEVAFRIQEGAPFFSVKSQGETIVDWSRVGLETSRPQGAWTGATVEKGEYDRNWEPVFGKRSPVRNHYNSMRVAQPTKNGEGTALEIVFRAYDDGIAFRYRIRSAGDNVGPVAVSADCSEFRLPKNSRIWHYNGENCPKGPLSLNDFGGNVRLPLLVEAGEDVWMAVAEAALYDFPPLKPRIVKDSGAVAIEIDATKVAAPFETPWRVLMIGDHPGDLVDSDLMMNLNPPCDPDAFAWLKSGVSFWDWRAIGYKAEDGFVYGQNFETWKRFIDLGAEAGVPFLLIDANWYGPEFSRESDPFTGGNSDEVKKAIEYGREKGVGLILYLNHVAGEKFGTEKILKAYSEWGAKGIKYGFLRGKEGRDKVDFVRKLIEESAANRLAINFHDGPVPPSGDERTWPNCNTREFCHAQSDAKRAFTPRTFILQAYVNNLMGPIDMDNGMFDLESSKKDRPRVFVEIPSTIVAETARTLIIYSGLTVIPDAADSYRRHPELFEFIAAEKQPWKESRTLAGTMGEYITTMRRTGNTYLVASATDEHARTIEIPLDFLPEGEFEALILEDGPNAHYQKNREEYAVKRRTVSAKDVIKANLAPGGGHCVLIRTE